MQGAREKRKQRRGLGRGIPGWGKGGKSAQGHQEKSHCEGAWENRVPLSLCPPIHSFIYAAYPGETLEGTAKEATAEFRDPVRTSGL